MSTRAYSTGLASAAEIGQAMSARAVRRSAVTTRPSLSDPHRAPMGEVGISLGRQTLRRLYASLEEVILAVAPPRSGKTAWMGNVVVDAPGACVATSTRTDLYEYTAKLRAGMGRVWVFNPEDLGGVASTLRWSPLAGCDDPQEAMLRAGYLLAGAPGSGTEDRHFWEGNAYKLLRCYLFAAAAGKLRMTDVARWVNNPRDRTALDILERQSDAPLGWASDVRQLVEGAPDKTRESVFLSLALTLQFMADPAVARAVDAGEESFSVDRFVSEQATLYLVGSERPYGSVAPLFSALTGHLFETAKRLASRRPGGRLDPPLMMALDEAALICPVPLERWTSDGGGRGIPLAISVQSPSQLYDRWGQEAGRTIWSNAAVKLIFGGLTVAEHLDEISALCGQRDERVLSVTGGRGQKRSRSLVTRRVPVMAPDAIRTLGKLRVLIVHRTTRPVLGRIVPVWQRRDVRRLAG